MIWAIVSSWYCFCWLYRASPSLATNNIINLILVLTISWYPWLSLLLCCWKRVFAMNSVYSWKNSISLCPASFCTLRQICLLLQCFLTSYLAFQPPMMKRTSFGGIGLVGLVGLHRTIHLQLLQYYWSGYRLGLPWYWMVCLGNEQRSFCHFWDCIQVLHFGFLLTVMATPFLLRDSCPQ